MEELRTVPQEQSSADTTTIIPAHPVNETAYNSHDGTTRPCNICRFIRVDYRGRGRRNTLQAREKEG